MAKHRVIGLDLAKNSNALVACDRAGKPLWRKTVRRASLQNFLVQQPVSTVVMEACAGAHFLAQQVEQMGHTAVLYPPKHVKSYQRGQKNDYNDARALVEAHQHGHLRPVPIKTVAQQDAVLVVLQRKQLKEEQVRLGNRMRALLAERGIVLSVGVRALKVGVPRVLEDADNGLTVVVRHILSQAYTRYLGLLEELAWYDRQLHQRAREDDKDGRSRYSSRPGAPINSGSINRPDIWQQPVPDTGFQPCKGGGDHIRVQGVSRQALPGSAPA